MAQPACVRYLRDYVAVPSVNPMGRSDVPDAIAGERRLAEHLREQLRGLGVDAEVIGAGARASVVAEVRPRDPLDTVMVASHIDTVPVDGMEIDPFDPAIREGRLYGRGSCDTKAGMAALVDALERVLARGTLRRHLILVGEADEELSSAGVGDVLEHLGDRRPDWVLATEPTGLRVVSAHKGIALARLRATGRACHSSDPGAGRNALVALARAILALDGLAGELGARPDPRLGPPTLSVGIASGGHAPNIVPDRAWLVMDRRILPGETVEGVRAELEAALAGVEDVAIESCRIEKHALDTPDDHPSVRATQRALRASGLPDEPAGVAFGTDAGVLAARGVPGVVVGPGSIAQAHTSREFVEVRQVETMADVFAHLLEGGD